jgi:hypothetical protein
VVYRGGQKVATVPAATAWYTDQSARPGITYRYAVEAVDGAGNRSARSAELPVTTGSAPPAPPRWRQGTVSNTGARVTGLTLRLNSPVAAGDLLVGWFGQFDSTGSVTVSDNVNGAWTRAPAATTFNGRGDVGLFYVPNAAYAGSGLTITVTASAPTFLQAVLAEYSGIAAANPLVTSVAVKDVSASAEALTTSVPAGSLVYAAITCGRSPNGATPAGGLAERSATPNGSTDDADVIATGGPQAAVWTFGAPVDWYAVSAVFRPAVP